MRLTAVNAVLGQNYQGKLPHYRKLLAAAQSAWIPAHQESCTWMVEDEDIPVIAKFFGLVPITDHGVALFTRSRAG
jgi:uncharacterized protein YecT (DUF1311 family)